MMSYEMSLLESQNYCIIELLFIDRNVPYRGSLVIVKPGSQWPQVKEPAWICNRSVVSPIYHLKSSKTIFITDY